MSLPVNSPEHLKAARIIDAHVQKLNKYSLPEQYRNRVPETPIDVFMHPKAMGEAVVYGFFEEFEDGDRNYSVVRVENGFVEHPVGVVRMENSSVAKRWMQQHFASELNEKIVRPRYSEWTLPGGMDYKERILVVKDSPGRRLPVFERHHFTKQWVPSIGNSADGYVAHTRQNTRKDDKGATGTFLEEMQSDRHQKGKREGYAEPRSIDEELKLKSELRQIQIEIEKNSDAYISEKNAGRVSDEEYLKFEENHNLLRRQQMELEEKLANPEIGIPDAPYRDSNAWILALFKRALKDAVDQNHDWIGWTDGDTQNERSNIALVDTFDFIRWDGNNLIAVTQDGTQVNESVRREDLSDVVGQNNADLLKERYDAAETEFYAIYQESLEEAVDKQLFDEGINPMDDGYEARRDELNAEKQKEAYDHAYRTASPEAVLEADDLAGGPGTPEPFRRMYDRQVPRVVNKYLKKYQLRANSDAVLEDGQSFWRIEISDKLRADIKEKGQPRF